ncbi:hypothetical protein QFZ94_004918 [Paraburkholderia sp. JPY465]
MNGDAASTRKRPDGRSRRARDRLLGLFERVENRAGATQERVAFLGQMQTPRRTPHQRGVELLFEAR